MKNIWIMQVELEFPVEDEEVTERFAGDTEKDFSGRALERIRPDLEKMISEGQIAHYHIIVMPRRGRC